MKKFDLTNYKDFQIYFNLFDVLIKNEANNIETFLESIFISPSSYRRAKSSGNKIGEQIFNELSMCFEYKICSDELIDEIDDNINKIYYDVYYKDYRNYYEQLEWIDEKINQKLIIFPILKLVKLFLVFNMPKSIQVSLENNRDLYNEIKQYESFYTGSLKELVEILDVTYREEIDDKFLSMYFTNELTYHTLATKCMLKEKYIESIYFCNIVKQKFINDENFKRVYHINLVLLANYNILFKFEEAYQIEKKQLHALSSLNIEDIELKLTKKHYINTCFGLNKYEEIIKELENRKSLVLTEAVCFLFSLFEVDKSKYNEIYSSLLLKNTDESIMVFYKTFNDFLQNRNKKALDVICTYNINKSVLEILKERKLNKIQ